MSAVKLLPPWSISVRPATRPGTSAVVRRSDLPGAFLLPRHVVDHQDDLIEAEGMQHIDRSDKMADVRRVECAPE